MPPANLPLDLDPNDFEEMEDGTLVAKTLEAAYQLAWAACDEGDSFTIHAAECPVDEQEHGCDCAAIRIVKGPPELRN